ncbi:hypothetical protein [Bacillus suaedaesalsae]|uniref:DUF2524 family protein n=1 Tax=Bacillus suaedaesalsae TaxID=2810349 RepID=A0ABS2DNW9_9BACI|nr:hypothetical protein [Bacillus suaedaesalsae]MBM6619288.1 hypothetical protein [Bacillus suaedaesalsae]
MENINITEEALKALHHAEEAVYSAQSNSHIEFRQKALQQLLIAKDKIDLAYLQSPTSDQQHRLHQAQEQLRHLTEAHQALEN